MGERSTHTGGARGGLRLPLPGFQLVEASAGTGKTYSLTTRYLLLLLHGGLTVDQILVVTFTVAATAELRDRIRSRIREIRDALEAATPEQIEDHDLRAALDPLFADLARNADARQRLTEALASFDEAAIFTIHGFCTRVLGEQAFVSGTNFELEVMQDDLDLLDTVVADFVRARFDRLTPAQYQAFLSESVLVDCGGSGSWEAPGRLMSAERLRTLRKLIGNPFLQIVPGRPKPHGKGGEDAKEAALILTWELIDHAREEFFRRKRESGAVAYDDMLLNVREALAGPDGERLARELRETFRAALIDEFQDTDPVQYDIFWRIYKDSDAPVVFVGDPKQAIYSFRGGDIFAYFEATRDLSKDRRSTLPVNYRSSARLVQSVSDLFLHLGQQDIFRDGRKTAFPEVKAHHPDGIDPRSLPTEGREALHWFLFPPRPEPKGAKAERVPAFLWRKPEAQKIALRITVEEIGRLLSQTAGERPLVPGDIAVLVPKNKEAEVVQAALRAAGIPSVLKVLGDVFGSEEARELLALIRAISAPQNESALSTALLSPYIGYSARELFAMKQDPLASERIAAQFVRLREIWHRRRGGFIRMAMELLHARGIGAGEKSIVEVIGELATAERTMTNILHLVELLHQESIRHPGSEHLVEWFERQIRDVEPESEERSIRLESDAQRVQIITIHSSKGLEFPVVFLPFAWEGRGYTRKKREVVFCHAPGGMTADLSHPARTAMQVHAEDEHVSESIRLLYVALTRARQRCYAVWGPVNLMQNAALSWLLYPAFDGESKTISTLGYDGVVGPVQELAKTSAGMSCSLIEAKGAAVPPPPPLEPQGGAFRPRSFTRGILLPSWQFASYTSLATGRTGSARDHDAAVEVAVKPEVREKSILTFPAGARTGIAWHALFERLDFQIPEEGIIAHVSSMLRRDGFDEEYAPAVAEMVRRALAVPVTDGGGGLRGVSENECLRELEFTFRLDRYRTGDVRRILADSAHGLPGEFRAATAQMEERTITGFMTGAIDLLFRHGEKYYILDYKSNHLGDSAASYSLPRVREAMAREHYYLQYLIYTVAVERYLRRRVAGYSYDRDFGGVIYLFLRGLPEGVFLDRPSFPLIEALDEHFGGGGR